MRPPLCQCFTAALAVDVQLDLWLVHFEQGFGGDPILSCLFPTSSQTTEFEYFCTFSPKLFQSTTLTFFPTPVFSNPSSHVSQLSSTVLPLSPSSFSPFPNLVHIAIQAPLSSQDWRVYWPPPLLHPSSPACKKQIKSSIQLGKLFIGVSIKVTGILADP